VIFLEEKVGEQKQVKSKSDMWWAWENGM